MTDSGGDPRSKLDALREQLVEWLVRAAYPRWAQHGIDPRSGGFVEALAQDGSGLAWQQRARVQPRQVYAFSQAPKFGWDGDAPGIVSRGIAYYVTRFRRHDGLFRTLVGVDGAPLDERALLYDQAFTLLGYAAAAAALDANAQFERRALELRYLIESRLGVGDGAFRSRDDEGSVAADTAADAAADAPANAAADAAADTPADTAADAPANAAADAAADTPADAAADAPPADLVVGVGGLRESNPHMHLLEACLTWAETGNDPGWGDWVRDLVSLAMTRFIHAGNGALGEAFTASWQRAPGIPGRILEPGHQFEWAWLLLRSERRHSGPLRETALRLIAIGEQAGVHGGVAVNALLDDWSIHDPNARCWPQTERLKATLLAARLTGEGRYWTAAHAAAASLLPYLETPVPGLWFDVRLPGGEFVDSPAPASTFYHLVGAIAALDQALSGRT